MHYTKSGMEIIWILLVFTAAAAMLLVITVAVLMFTGCSSRNCEVVAITGRVHDINSNPVKFVSMDKL